MPVSQLYFNRRSPHKSYWQLSRFYLFYFIALGVWVPFWPLYLQSIGYGALAVGLTNACFHASRIIAPNVWGAIADHKRQRLKIIRCGCLLALISCLGIFFNQNFIFLCIVIALFGFFWSAVLPQFEVLTIAKLQDKIYGYGKVRLWGSLGFGISVLTLGVSFQYIDISWFPWIIALSLLMLWLSSLLIRREVPYQDQLGSTGFMRQLISPRIWVFVLVVMLVQISFAPYYSFFSLYLQAHHYSPVMIGVLWGFSIVSEVILFFFIGYFFRRFSLKSILLICIFLTLLRWLLLGSFADSLLVLFLVQSFHGFCFGAFHTCIIEQMQRFFVAQHLGKGQALISSLGYGLGAMMGAGISGLLWQQYQGDLYLLAAVVAAVAFIVCLFIDCEKRVGD